MLSKYFTVPKDELSALCGCNSGDRSTITTQVHLADDTYLDMMGVAHRRGPKLHTFVATAGLTLHCEAQAHENDDLDPNALYIIQRKCPKVLNYWTYAQPKIDRHNLLRQHMLAMEKRFETESFSFRLFCTCLGMIFYDAYYAYICVHSIKYCDLPFPVVMRLCITA